jgi:hypothetical protein
MTKNPLRLPAAPRAGRLGDFFDFDDGGTPQYLWHWDSPTTYVVTDNAVVNTATDPTTCDPSYLFRSPDMASVEVRCGVPDYKSVFLRKVPGTPLEVFTPRNTYLYVHPSAAPEPKLSWGVPPQSYVKLGMWGNSPLYSDKGYPLSAYSADLQAIVKNGGQPPAPIDPAVLLGKPAKSDLLTFTPSTLLVLSTAKKGQNGTIHTTFPPNGKPPTQGGSQEGGAAGGSGGQASTTSDGPGIGTVLGVLAALGLGAYALTRMR